MLRGIIFLLLTLGLVMGMVTCLGWFFRPPPVALYDGVLHDPAGYVLLDVPFIPQTGEYDCAKAALAMVLEFHAFAHNPTRLEQEFVGPQGAYVAEVMRYLRMLGIPSTTFFPTNERSVVRMLKAGFPLLIPNYLQAHGRSWGHMVVLTGANDDYFVVNDPSVGKNLLVKRDAFTSRWISPTTWTRQAIAVLPYNISPKRYALEFSEVSQAFDRATQQLGQDEQAVSTLTKIVDAHPEFLPARLTLGFELIRSHRWTEAQAILQGAVELDAEFCWGVGWVGLAAVYSNLGDTVQAENSARQFFELAARNTDSLASAPPVLRTLANNTLHFEETPAPATVPFARVLRSTAVAALGFYVLACLLHSLPGARGAIHAGSVRVLRLSLWRRAVLFTAGLAWLGLACLIVALPPILPPLLNLAGILAGVLVWFQNAGICFIRLEYDQAGLRYHSLWRGARHLGWSDVVSFRYSLMSSAYVLKAHRRTKLRVPRAFMGLPQFRDAARHQLSRMTFSSTDWITLRPAA